MRTTRRALLIMGLVFARDALARDAETLTFTIHVSNYAGIDDRTLLEAKKVAAGIFRKAGVEVEWADPADQGWLVPSHIQLRLLPSLMCDRLSLPDNAMGVAPGRGPDRRFVYVCYNRVEALALKHVEYTYADTAKLLGHAMAHEIGHVLNIESHSATGIMRADWGLKDLQDAGYGDLLFTPPQSEVLRAEVGRRLRERPSK